MNAPVKRSRFEPDPHGHYAEESWIARRLFEVERFEGPILDPACGFGRVVEAAAAAGFEAYGSDIEARWQHGPEMAQTDEMRGSYMHADFLARDWPTADGLKLGYWNPGAIVSNPPYHKAREFIDRALVVAPKVAMILPATFGHGTKPSRWLDSRPLYRVYTISPRPSMLPGTELLAGRKPGGGQKDYSLFLFLRGFEGAPTIHSLRRGEVRQ